MANWLGEKLEDRDGFIPKTMLSVPIFNGARDVIGVAQLINKVRIVNRIILHAINYLFAKYLINSLLNLVKIGM